MSGVRGEYMNGVWSVNKVWARCISMEICLKNAWPPLSPPSFLPCVQTLRFFLQQEGDLRLSEAWARLQPAKDVIGSIVSSTARFFKDLVSVGCGGCIGGEDLRETARRIGGIAAHPTLLPFPAHRSEGEVPPLQWRQHSPPPPSEASARK